MGALSIYKTLTGGGLTPAGALGLMGNLYAESALKSNIVQVGFSNGLSDTDFTAEVDNNGWPSWFQGGYGLAQWTYYTRRNALLAYAKLQGVSIGNEQMQVEFCLAELASDYSGLLSYLKTTDDLYTATSRVCTEYERPAYNNIDARYQYAQNLASQVGAADSGASDQAQTEPAAEVQTDKTANVQVGFRMLYKGISGYKDQVIFMQQVLNLKGYAPAIDGIFGDETDCIVKQFQTDNGLTADGYAGHDTLTALYGGI